MKRMAADTLTRSTPRIAGLQLGSAPLPLPVAELLEQSPDGVDGEPQVEGNLRGPLALLRETPNLLPNRHGNRSGHG